MATKNGGRSNGPRKSRGAGPDYEIGYGKPPAQTRFKPGQSGNPRGRPKRSRNFRILFDHALDQKVTIREGDKERTLTKREALVVTVVNGALMKDPKSFAVLLAMARAIGLISAEPEESSQPELSADDHALIAGLFVDGAPAHELEDSYTRRTRCNAENGPLQLRPGG